MFNFRSMVRVLAAHQVDFAIVGGMAAVMQGAPIHTQDLDVLYSLEPPNPERILGAVLELGATFVDDPRRLAPSLSHMQSRGHKLLGTSVGRLDCLGTIEDETTFEDLAQDFDWMDLDGTAVRVLSLERLIEVKRKLTRAKDRLTLLQLEATLDERRTGK